jgi:hypothetical protein
MVFRDGPTRAVRYGDRAAVFARKIRTCLLIFEGDADVFAVAPYHPARASPAAVEAKQQDEVCGKHRGRCVDDARATLGHVDHFARDQRDVLAQIDGRPPHRRRMARVLAAFGFHAAHLSICFDTQDET